MNPPAPRAPAAAAPALLTDGISASLRVPSAGAAASSAAPYASAPWSPSTRGWLEPTAAQQAADTILSASERAKEQALALNRAANPSAMVLHADPRSSFRAVDRPSAAARVLEEEDYLANMERIIRRDFFPAVDAMERKIAVPTPAWNGKLTDSAAQQQRARQRRARAEGRPSSNFGDETPMTERPLSPELLEPGAPAAAASSAVAAASSAGAVVPRHAAGASDSDASGTAASVLLRPDELRLGSFLELHTSEDNASFSDAEVKRRKLREEKRPWANAAFEQKANDTRIVLADDPERGGNPSGWAVKVKNRLFFYPEHEGRSELTADAYADASQTPAQQVANALAQRSASIEYENTRFPGLLTNPFPGVNASSKPKANPSAASPAAAAAGGNTPAVGGYKLLRTPVPVPGVGEDEPPITWGQVVSTPAHLAHEDSIGAAEERAAALQLALDPAELEAAEAAAAAVDADRARFRIAPTPSRDEVAWRMSETARVKALEHKKRKREDATPVPLARAPLTPAAASSRTPMLSPAAQRLMERTLRTASSSGSRSRSGAARPAGGVDMQLRASYSPAVASGARPAAAAGSRSLRPPVPLFNATPSPLRLQSTPAPLR